MLTREIRNSKSEIRNKSEARSPNDRNTVAGRGVRFGSWIWSIHACFGFRNSNFGFPTLCLTLLALCMLARADVLESARMLPDDMMVLVSVESVNGLRAAMEKTSLYSLYKDPSMQPFVTETEKKIREVIDTRLKDFWQKMQIENPPQQLPIPEGRLVLGISLAKPSTATSPGRPGANGPAFRFTVLADMGGRAETARKTILSLTTSATNAGAAVSKKSVGGLELNVITPKDSGDPTLCYGMKDNWLVLVGDATKELAFAESVVQRMGRSLPGSLSDKVGLRSAAKTLGESQLFVFVNADAIRSFVAGMAPDKAQVDRVIQALGLKNVTGLSMAAQIGGQRNQEGVSRMLIGIDGPRTGIPALLGDASGPLKLNARLLSRDAVGFLCANYEPTRIFDAANKIVQGVAYMDLNMIAQMGMAATAGEGGQPAVQLRDDVLAQMGAPVLFTWQMEKPYTFASETKFLIGLSVKDATRLDGAVGRIHQAFLGGQPESRREMLNHTLYLLPSGPSDMDFENEDEEDTDNPAIAAAQVKEEAMALSVAGDTLVFGQVDDVEQAIRNQQKEPQDSLLNDPMFRYAKDSLPSQACLFAYQNNRLNSEITWAALKQLGKDLAKQDASDDQDGSWNPMLMALQKIKAYVDLNKLPEFKAVEKYWGATVGYMQSRPEGLYWESVTLRPPQQ